MAFVPTEAEIDAMSEAELEAYLSGSPDETTDEAAYQGDAGSTLTGWRTLGGAPRRFGVGLLLAALVAIAACWELMFSELEQLRTPDAVLSCDINPLISCGASLNVWQGNLLGVPNSFVGAMAFAIIAASGALLAVGVKLPRWYWWAILGGLSLAMIWVVWFWYESLFVLAHLCPYCMLIWTISIPTFTNTLAHTAKGGHLPVSKRAANVLMASRWWAAALIIVVIAASILIRFWDQWMVII